MSVLKSTTTNGNWRKDALTVETVKHYFPQGIKDINFSSFRKGVVLVEFIEPFQGNRAWWVEFTPVIGEKAPQFPGLVEYHQYIDQLNMRIFSVRAPLRAYA